MTASHWVARAAAALPFAFAACAYPALDGSTRPSTAFAHPERTRLGQELADEIAEHPGASGLFVLGNGLDAFAARIAAIEAAEQALDVQTYILHDDVTGGVLVHALLEAADRGVRVRLLVDDLGSNGIDELLAAANVHPYLEVRLFNPRARGPWPWLAKTLDLLGRPIRVNHRMHNKLLAADGVVGVVGGRNIGDEYFDAAEGVNFGDLDLLALGPVAAELGAAFDLYWNSEFTERLDGWGPMERDAAALVRLRAELGSRREAASDSPYALRLSQADFVQAAAADELPLVWAPTHAFSDLPCKIVADRDEIRETLLIEKVLEHMPAAERELLIVSPYFVPRASGVEHLVAAAERGVRVRVLTNSLAGSDVPVVHAGYKAYRRALLRGGVELFEFQPTGDEVRSGFRRGLFGSKSASLHAKTFVTDRRHVFVGSLNLDPRSVDLNTEIGLVVDSEELAADIAARIDTAMAPQMSWRVELDGDALRWTGLEDGEARSWSVEPETSWWARFKLWWLGWLPIEGQL